MKRYKVVLGLFASIVIVSGVLAAHFYVTVNPPKHRDRFGKEVMAFDEYMTSIGYERMPSIYECYSGDFYALYSGYAYDVNGEFAYARESGDGHIHMYIPPALHPEEYFYTLYPDLDFSIDRGGKDDDGRNVYWNDQADMCLSISPVEAADLDVPGHPATLNYAIYRNKDYALAIRNVWANRDKGEFRYYFTYHGEMSMFCDMQEHGDLWISVADPDERVSLWSVTLQQ